MVNEHPNVQMLKRLDLGDLASAQDLFAENAVWHYFNPNLPEVQGDYVGLDGIRSFFQVVGKKTRGTFKVEPVSITAVGDELVVVQVRDTMTFSGAAHRAGRRCRLAIRGRAHYGGLGHRPGTANGGLGCKTLTECAGTLSSSVRAWVV